MAPLLVCEKNFRWTVRGRTCGSPPSSAWSHRPQNPKSPQPQTHPLGLTLLTPSLVFLLNCISVAISRFHFFLLIFDLIFIDFSMWLSHDSSPDESPKHSSPTPTWLRFDSLSLTASVASLKHVVAKLLGSETKLVLTYYQNRWAECWKFSVLPPCLLWYCQWQMAV